MLMNIKVEYEGKGIEIIQVINLLDPYRGR